jgi:hypothetical protein
MDTDNTEKRGPGRPPKPREPETFPVKFVRGYFPLDGGPKLPAGTETELPVSEAIDVIQTGVAVRADALPKA